MKRILITITVLVLVLGVVAPTTVRAASPTDYFPLVTCGGTDDAGVAQPPCTPCKIFESGFRVVNMILFGITGPLAAFMVLLAGGLMILGGADPSRYSQGKTILTNTLMGVAVVLLAWVGTTFLVKSIGGGSNGDTWYEFTCPPFLQQAGQVSYPATVPSTGSAQQPNPVLVQANQKLCDPATLAASYGVPSTPTNAPSLTTMMTCIEQDPVVKAAIGGRFTYEQDHPLCNYTRGARTCSLCAHAVNSCHYGGATGTQGAMAVDYSWNRQPILFYYPPGGGNGVVVPAGQDCSKVAPAGTPCHSVNGNAALEDAIYHSIAQNKCQYKFLNYEGTHVHVSTADCSSDGTGFGGRTPTAQ